VLCNGVFDLLHIAHVRHLEEARQQGDALIVAVTEDSTVGKGNGRPVIPLMERMEMLRALRCVSAVSHCRDSIDALKSWKPHVFCKGYDYVAKGLLPEEVKFCAENGILIYHTKPNPQTTSGIIERIRCAS